MVLTKEWLFSVLEKHRAIVILLFCLPASFVFSLFLKVHFYFKRLFNTKDHSARVREIQVMIQKWNRLPRDKRKLLCTARPNWLSLSTTFFQKNLYHKVPINLHNILCLDEQNLRVKVEPLCTVGDITSFLLPRGYALAVHLEIAEATLGGLAMGAGMTTHSHRVGLYHETIYSFDVLLADGTLVHTTKNNQYADLYRALPWSHGTLGFIVALELDIILAKPYVHLNYIPVRGKKKYCSMIRELSGADNQYKQTPDFLEAVVFSKEEAVVIVGWFSNPSECGEQVKVNCVSRWYKSWFYQHVETFLSKGNGEELVPLGDYLLRHNRSIFWVMESLLHFGNKPIFRFLLGWLLPPKVAFLKFTTTQGIRRLSVTKQVFQDIVLPMVYLEEQIDVCEDLFDLYPLLIYPCRVYDNGPRAGQLPRPAPHMFCPGTNYSMYNDLGIYGVPGYVKRKVEYKPTEAMRKMEAFTVNVGGFPFLYADVFMTRPEFERMFDLQLYTDVRKKYGADVAFPHLYDKIKPEIDVFHLDEENKYD